MYNTVDNTTPTSNFPLRGGKASMFEGGIRVPLIVSWPGKVKQNSRNDSHVHSDDFYPTILDMLQLKPQPGQSFDGTSFLPALQDKPYRRSPAFTYFPHDPPVPDWIPPSIAVHDGDWKLIRIFHGGDAEAHRWKLFNLRDDIGERRNLADVQPDRVKHMDALIEEFLARTKAVRPKPNPTFNPAVYRPEDEGRGRIRTKSGVKKSDKTAKKNGEFPGLQGWKARHTKYIVKDGVVTLTTDQPNPFLGIGAQVSGPAEVNLAVQSPKGGKGRIEWITPGGKPRSVPFTVKSNEWHSINVAIPASGPLGILRVYLPAQKQPVSVASIELRSKAGQLRRWDF